MLVPVTPWFNCFGDGGFILSTTVTIRGAEQSGVCLANRRVALVEENRIIRLALEGALRRAGARVVTLSDVETGVAALGLGVPIDPALGPIIDNLRHRSIRFLFYGGPDVDFESVLRRWPECTIVPRPQSLNDFA